MFHSNTNPQESKGIPSFVAEYNRKGWEVPFPLAPNAKYPPVAGVTGRIPDVKNEEVHAVWGCVSDDSNVGLRMQVAGDYDVLSIDVDQYDNKRGKDNLSELMETLGALPLHKWHRSTRRGLDSDSAQFFVRVPKGLEWHSKACADVDIVQKNHRYSAVWPSKADGQTYRWYLGGKEIDIPHVDELPILPEVWVDYLQRDSLLYADIPAAPERGYEDALEWLKGRVLGGESDYVPQIDWEDVGGRHDAMNKETWSLVCGAVFEGSAGLLADLATLRAAFLEAVGDIPERVSAYERSLKGAVAKAEGAITAEMRRDCNWLEVEGIPDFSDLIAGAVKKQAKKAQKKAQKKAKKAKVSRGLGTERTYSGLRFSSLETAVIRSAQWVWGGEDKGGIPVGGLTIVTGKPGDGKSTMCRWLAAEITHGSLPGTWNGTPHSVLYLSAEESQDHMVTPSLVANGADMSRVHVILDPLNPAEDMEKVIAFCKDNDVKVVFVDPLSSYMGGITSYNNSEYREALNPWGRLAEEIDGAVIAIVHQTKSSGSNFVSGISGSSAYGEVARAVFATAVDAETGKRVVSQGKNSLGPLMASHEYVLEIESLKTVDGEAKTSPRFSLGGETELSAGEIFNRNKKIDSGEAQTAKSWLRDYLEANPGGFKAVITEAAKGLYSVSAIEKASKDLKVRTEYEDRKARWYLS